MKTPLEQSSLRLKEVPIEGTTYFSLEPLEPGQYMTIPERVAIARRIQELNEKIPKYVRVERRGADHAGSSATRDGVVEAAGTTQPTQTEKTMETDKTTKSVLPAGGLDVDEITRAHARNVKEVKKRDEAKAKADAAAKAKADAAAKAKAASRAEVKAAVKAKVKKIAAKKSAVKKDADPAARVAGVSAAPEKFAGYPLTARITVVSKESDFVDGSIRDQVFKKLLRCTTVAEAQKVSSDPWHLKNAVKKNRVKVAA